VPPFAVDEETTNVQLTILPPDTVHVRVAGESYNVPGPAVCTKDTDESRLSHPEPDTVTVFPVGPFTGLRTTLDPAVVVNGAVAVKEPESLTVTMEVLGEPVTVNLPTRVPSDCSVQVAGPTAGPVTEPAPHVLAPPPKPAPANKTLTPTGAAFGDSVICGITLMLNVAVSLVDPWTVMVMLD